MRLFGSLTELVTVSFRQNGQLVVLEPNSGTTYTATRTHQLPPGDSSQILLSDTSSQTVTNKSISGSTNTITNVSLTTGVTGTLPVGNGGTGTTTSTGSGSVVLSNSPTLVTPALGTPSAIVLTNGTGLPLTTGVTGTLPIGNGGTNATTAAAAFANLSPLTTAGDLIYENATPTPARLPIGSTGNVLTVSGGLPVWAAPATNGTVTSVNVSGGTTGLTTSGGPVTSSGTITLAGTLAIANGGTGQTTASAAFGALSPLTTKGDLLAFSTVNDRLPVGTNGQILTADSTQALGVKWATSSSSGATPTSAGVVTSYFPTIQSAINVLSNNTGYTITTTDGYLEIIGNITTSSTQAVTLPAASSNNGRVITIRRENGTGIGSLAVTAAGTDVITLANGPSTGLSLTSLNLGAAFESVTLIGSSTLGTWDICATTMAAGSGTAGNPGLITGAAQVLNGTKTMNRAEQTSTVSAGSSNQTISDSSNHTQFISSTASIIADLDNTHVQGAVVTISNTNTVNSGFTITAQANSTTAATNVIRTIFPGETVTFRCNKSGGGPTAAADWTVETPASTEWFDAGSISFTHMTASASSFLWRRSGDTMQVKGHFVASSSNNSNSNDVSLAHPAINGTSVTVDTSKIVNKTNVTGTRATGNSYLYHYNSSGTWNTSSGSSFDGIVVGYQTSTSVILWTRAAINTGSTGIDAVGSANFPVASGDIITFYYEIPVSGWTANRG